MYIYQLLFNRQVNFCMKSEKKIEKQMRLSDLQKGDEAHIEGFEDDEAHIEGFEDDEASFVRLRDMGLHDGISLRVIKFAPLGDPIEIKTRGFYLSIRKSLANRILIKKNNGIK